MGWWEVGTVFFFFFFFLRNISSPYHYHYYFVGRHHHDLFLTEEQMHALKRNGTQVHVFTSLNKGHSHEMVLERDPHRIDEDRLKVVLCDGKPDCWDHHGHYVTIRHD